MLVYEDCVSIHDNMCLGYRLQFYEKGSIGQTIGLWKMVDCEMIVWWMEQWNTFCVAVQQITLSDLHTTTHCVMSSIYIKSLRVAVIWLCVNPSVSTGSANRKKFGFCGETSNFLSVLSTCTQCYLPTSYLIWPLIATNQAWKHFSNCSSGFCRTTQNYCNNSPCKDDII